MNTRFFYLLVAIITVVNVFAQQGSDEDAIKYPETTSNSICGYRK